MALSSEKVIEWATSLCGIMFDKEDQPVMMGYMLDEDYIAQIKEDRLAMMLAREVIQNNVSTSLFNILFLY